MVFKVTSCPGDFGVTLNNFDMLAMLLDLTLLISTAPSLPNHVRLIIEILNLITQMNHIALDHWSFLYRLHKKVFKVTPNCSKLPHCSKSPRFMVPGNIT